MSQKIILRGMFAVVIYFGLRSATPQGYLSAGVLIGLLLADLNEWHIAWSFRRKYGYERRWRKIEQEER